MSSSSLLSRSGEIDRRRFSLPPAATGGETSSSSFIPGGIERRRFSLPPAAAGGETSSSSFSGSSSSSSIPGEIERRCFSLPPAAAGGETSSSSFSFSGSSSSSSSIPGEIERRRFSLPPTAAGCETSSSSSSSFSFSGSSSSSSSIPGEIERRRFSLPPTAAGCETSSSFSGSSSSFSIPGDIERRCSARGGAMSSSSSTSKELQCVCLLSSSAAIGGTSSSIFTSGELCLLLLLKYFVESGAELMGITPRLLSVIKEILISEVTKLEGHCSQDLGCAWSPSVSLLSFWTGRSTGSTWNIANDPCGSSMNILSANVQGLEYWTDTSYQKRKNVLTLDWNAKPNPPIVVASIPKMKKDNSLRAVKLKKGTTLGAFLHTEGWLLMCDSTLTTESDGPNKQDHTRLKVGKTNDRFVTMEAGKLWISEILDMEIRSFICDIEELNTHVCQKDGNENYSHYIEIANMTHDAIKEKIEIAFEWYSDGEFQKEYMEGFLILVDRMSKFCLALRAEKMSNKDTFTLSAYVQSRASYGSPLVKSLFNKMSAKTNLKEATEAMTRIMKMATEDEYTGGVFSLFRGGTSKWGNIHSEDFRVPKRKRSFIDKRYVMDEYQNPLDKKEVVFEVAYQVFGDLCLKPLEEGNTNMNENMLIIQVEDFNVYVPNDYMLVSELKELIRHGSCASMLKYPTIFSSRIILRMGKNFLRDDDRVWPYERTIDVLVEEEFIVKVYIDGEPFTVTVTEMTAVRHIKARLMKLNPDMDLRSRHLTYKDRKVGRNLLMYDLGVRSVPDKKGLLWKTNGSKDPMAKLQEMQKAYNFKLVKIVQ